ncbi:zinc metallopeptidase [soil metagenome]
MIYGYDPMFMLLMILLGALMWGASAFVKSRFKKYSRVRTSSGMTGAQAAHLMLERSGVPGVPIERADGFLSDHYDPTKRVIRLSPDVYDSNSISAVGVACHEAGHAVQHARKYIFLPIRSLAVPMANSVSKIGFWIIIAGLIMHLTGLAIVGLALFSTVALFQIINLPVEFDATARAKKAVVEYGIVQRGAEADGVSKVLNAAALTYLAATLAAVVQVAYFAMQIFGGRRR